MGKWSYKSLLSEKQFLKVQARARALMRDGTNLLAIDYKERKLYFKTRSGTDRHVIWTQVVEITDASIPNILSAKKFKDVDDLIMNSGLKVYCDCPAFLFWGYKYMAWKKGYGLNKEFRRPTIRNPYEQGHLCKHLYLVLQLYPFWSKTLASKFRKWAELKQYVPEENKVEPKPDVTPEDYDLTEEDLLE